MRKTKAKDGFAVIQERFSGETKATHCKTYDAAYSRFWGHCLHDNPRKVTLWEINGGDVHLLKTWQQSSTTLIPGG